MSPDELRQHLSHASSFSWSNGMRGIPSGSGSGSFTGDAEDRWTGLEGHET
jgi:hypothetical protein